MDEVLPFVIKVREEHGDHGPVTDQQYEQARLQASLAKAASLEARAEEKMDKLDPRHREVFSMMLANMKDAVNDLTGLNKDSLDQQDSEWLASRAEERAGRLKALTEKWKRFPE